MWNLENFSEFISNKLIKKGFHPRTLGRKTPKNWDHVDKYPLRETKKLIVPVPIVIGINWYSDFDNPVQYEFTNLDGTKVKRWVVAKDGIRGFIRGGHCVCIKSQNLVDYLTWWDFYDQGSEGACVGFGTSRMMSLFNRNKYDARWLWDRAKEIDEWPDTNACDDEGTSVNAGLKIANTKGGVKWSSTYANYTCQQRKSELSNWQAGISSYRWALSIDEVRSVLQSDLNDRMQAVPFLNSWGRFYPRITWLPYKALERLIREDGEIGIPSDR